LQESLRASTGAKIIEGETIMFGQRVIRKAVRAGLLALIGMSIMAANTRPSFAGGTCGPHCQANRMCTDLVKKKGVKGAQFKSEHEKCMEDAQNYK
jgi:hypothetical protein